MLSRRNLLCAGMLTPFTSTAWAADSYTAGSDYLLVKPPVAGTSQKIQVIEFFAYTCPHCFLFQPIFDTWMETAPADVEVTICPVSWTPQTLPLTKTFFTLEMLGLRPKLSKKFFESVYYETHPYSFDSLETDILDFMVENGIDEKKWRNAYNSFGVMANSQRSVKLWQDYHIDSTPMVGIGGQYITGPHLVGSREKMPALINYLIEKCRHEKHR